MKIIKTTMALAFAVALSAPAFSATNVAPLGTASQSSTNSFPEYNGSGPASRAIDGNTDGYFWDGSVTHTASNGNNWWTVALDKDYALESISVFNRTDCCDWRINGFTVSVYNNGSEVWSSGSIATFTPTIIGSNVSGMSFNFGTVVTGDQVTIAINNGEPLSLAEVQVMAVPEPETYAMLLAGLGVLGAVARRRKAQQA